MFSMFIDDIELYLHDRVGNGLELGDITLILLLFADDMVILGKSPVELQHNLNLLYDYCNRWGLHVNTDKTKINGI